MTLDGKSWAHDEGYGEKTIQPYCLMMLGSTAGVAGEVWMLWTNFCLWTCTFLQSTAFDWGLGLTVASFALLVVSLVLAVKAIRRRDGRPWAVAALCLAGIPVLYGLIGVSLAYLALGF